MYDRESRAGDVPDPDRRRDEPRSPLDPGGYYAAGTPVAGLDPRVDPPVHQYREDDRSIGGGPARSATRSVSGDRLIELREEELVARKDLRELGEVEIRTEVEEVPARLEVEAYREEVEVEHVPVGEVVSERLAPWEEDGILVVPVYEEQLVLVKRLVLREKLKVRRVATTETRLFEDLVRRERLIVEDPNDTGLVHERYPTAEAAADYRDDRTDRDRDREPRAEGGFFENLVRKALP